MKHVKARRGPSAKTRALIALFCAIFLAGLTIFLWPELVGFHLTHQAHVAVSEFFDMSAAVENDNDVTFEYVEGPMPSPSPRPYPELYEAMQKYNAQIYANGQAGLTDAWAYQQVSLVNVMSRETVLKQYLADVKKNYDYVLLDCRPSLGMLVLNCLAAADYVLIPVQADYLAAEDMTELVSTVNSLKRQVNPRLKIGGIFLTMGNSTAFRKDIMELVKKDMGKQLPVFDTVIPATVRLAEVSTADKSIFLHEPRGKAAEAYRNLVKEVLDIGEKKRSRSNDLAR